MRVKAYTWLRRACACGPAPATSPRLRFDSCFVTHSCLGYAMVSKRPTVVLQLIGENKNRRQFTAFLTPSVLRHWTTATARVVTVPLKAFMSAEYVSWGWCGPVCRVEARQR